MSDIVLKNVYKSYKEKAVFENLNLTIETGKITVVLGESGSGKTTLLRILSGLTDCEGSVENVPKKKSYVFQEDRLLPHKTVLENVMFVVKTDKKGKDGTAEKRAVAVAALKKANMTEENLYPSELSGGMAKRVSFARAVAANAPLVLMDEPFSALDIKLKAVLISEFKEIVKADMPTVVLVTHSPYEATRLGDNIAIVKDKHIAFFKKAEATTESEIIKVLES